MRKLLEENLPLHLIIEREIEQSPYGQMTFNVTIKGGRADLKTLNIVKSRRRKYKMPKAEELDRI